MVSNLVDYKDIHKDKDIYVIGSGSSCDFIEESFFENKITIGINQVYKKFKTTYLVRKDFSMLEESINIKDVNTVLFVSIGGCGKKKNKKNKEYIDKNYSNDKSIVIYDHNNNSGAPRFRITSDKLNKLNNDQLIVSHSTITTGIYLAAYMGAKNIILVGHDCGTIDGKSNFKNYHIKTSRKQRKNAYNKWLHAIEKDTIILKNELKNRYNCNVYSINPFVSFNLEGHKFK
tara:strand:- start:138 stop:830 length:693 start_codon:yes stop_codon:yes gene_type:complete